jgi:hypothetical protein
MKTLLFKIWMYFTFKIQKKENKRRFFEPLKLITMKTFVKNDFYIQLSFLVIGLILIFLGIVV